MVVKDTERRKKRRLLKRYMGKLPIPRGGEIMNKDAMAQLAPLITRTELWSSKDEKKIAHL